LKNYPIPFFLVLLLALWIAEQVGVYWRRRRPLKAEERDDFNLIEGATLTLLGLIIGFSFSMAVSRYDQRKNYEEEEANAIGTEYVRADLLPAADAATVRSQLAKYVKLRIVFYQTRNARVLRQVNSDTARLQAQMWSAVEAPAAAHPSPLMALVVSGMNDVLNSQGYTQAAWWNRIPRAAWVLMILIAICANILAGYGLHTAGAEASFLFILPLIVSISFLLIADIDSPRGGLIRLTAPNLISLSRSLSQ